MAASQSPNLKSAAAALASPSPSTRRAAANESPAAARFEAYHRLQAAAAACGEKLPIPEIVVIGGKSDGKSSVLEGLLGFRFNVHCESTRRPLVLQMVHDPAALEPRCRFQEEDSEEYGSPMVMATAIADLIKQRTESHLRKVQAAVSSKPIVIRAEYARCPTLTIIDTPGLVLEAIRGQPRSTPDEIRSMVKSLAAPPDRLLLFVHQSSFSWGMSIWLSTLREIDPTFRRTMVVISKFDNRLKEIERGCEVDNYLSARGYLGGNIHPFAVALPMHPQTISNEEFRRNICQVDTHVLCQLRDVKGGFNDEKHGSYVGFSCLKKCLESELHKRYKEAALATLKLLEQGCTEINGPNKTRVKTSNVGYLSAPGIGNTSCIFFLQMPVLDGAAHPHPDMWGKTTEEEKMHSGIDIWPGINMPVKPANSTLKLYGGAAFVRLIDELHCAAYSMECPQVSRVQAAYILAAPTKAAAAEIARVVAQSWFAPLIDTACDRIAFLLQSWFDLAMEHKRNTDSENHQNVEDMDSSVDFLAALRSSYYKFVEELSKQCKQKVHEHIDFTWQRICYDNVHEHIDFLSGIGSNLAKHLFGLSFDLADSGYELQEAHENSSPRDQQDMTPRTNKGNESKEVLRESQLTVPGIPSPDLPSGIHGGKKKNIETLNDGGPRKRHAGMTAYTNRNHHNSMVGADDRGSKSEKSYSTICKIFAEYFAKLREALIETNVPSALKSGFITPWYAQTDIFR